MKYRSTDELESFDFKEAYIIEMKQMNGYFFTVLDNVKILPENSHNRDIRKMRTNQLLLKILEGRITEFTEEGYKVYDADGNLKEQYADKILEEKEYQDLLKSFEDCSIYDIRKVEQEYQISIDAEEHTYLLKIAGTHDVAEWDRFLML